MTKLKNDVVEFLNRPWQEDKEIDFVNLVDENSDKIMVASDFTIRLYLKRLYEENKSILAIWTSDAFMTSLENLLKEEQ